MGSLHLSRACSFVFVFLFLPCKIVICFDEFECILVLPIRCAILHLNFIYDGHPHPLRSAFFIVSESLPMHRARMDLLDPLLITGILHFSVVELDYAVLWTQGYSQ